MNKKKKIIISCLILLLIGALFYFMNIYSTVAADIKLRGFSSPPLTEKKQSVKPASSDHSSYKGQIPDSIVAFSSGYAVVVDKEHQKLYVFYKSGKYSKVFETVCSTGKNPGSKRIAGDAKTPNGIFFATRILENPGPPETYGSLAFTLDYPTLSDKRAGKDGNNIWIHGTTKPLLPQQSNGCVVLSDEDMKKLANFIHLNRTPVIISESINWVDQDYLSDSRDEFEKILWSWNKAFVEKNLKEIDSLYAEGAQIRGKKREDLHYKIKNLDFIKKHFVLQPRDIAILQEGDNAVIIFDQIFDVKDNNTFQGFYNKLVLEKINENWYVVDESSVSEPADRRLATAKDTQKDAVSPEKIAEKNIRSLVRKWRSSWESGSMKTYRACYASDFQSRDMGLDAWIAHKIKVRQKSNNIKISVNNLQISMSGNTARATFVQQYSSSILRTKGSKTLELKKSADGWKIHREIM